MTAVTNEPVGRLSAGASVEDRLDILTAQVQLMADELRLEREQRQTWAELLGELPPISSEAMVTLTRLLQELDEKGYFAFARGGADIVDKVVTSFTEDDVAALGDNIVLILSTVKEMTQPEVMTLLQRTAVTAQDVEDEFEEPPSMFALLRQMRDPKTRRGLGRTMTLLRSIGEEPSQTGRKPHEGR